MTKIIIQRSLKPNNNILISIKEKHHISTKCLRNRTVNDIKNLQKYLFRTLKMNATNVPDCIENFPVPPGTADQEQVQN